MIRILFGVGGVTLVFFGLLCLSLAMASGVAVAYDVEDPDDAVVSFNGTHLQIGPDDPEQVLPESGTAWSDFEVSERGDTDVDGMHAELSGVEDDVEAFDSVVEDTVFESVFDATGAQIAQSAMYAAYTTIGTFGNAYATFFVEHRDRIPESLANAYVFGYITSVWGAFMYVKLKGLRKVVA